MLCDRHGSKGLKRVDDQIQPFFARCGDTHSGCRIEVIPLPNDELFDSGAAAAIRDDVEHTAHQSGVQQVTPELNICVPDRRFDPPDRWFDDGLPAHQTKAFRCPARKHKFIKWCRPNLVSPCLQLATK